MPKCTNPNAPVFYWIASLCILRSNDHIVRAIQINTLQLVPGSNTYMAVYGLL